MSSRSKTRPHSVPSPPRADARPRKALHTALLALCLIAGIGAAGYSLWLWHESSRPGAVRYLSGLDYASARQFGHARNEWVHGVDEDPTYPQCWVQLGDFYAQANDYTKGALYYQGASKLLPDDGLVFFHLGQMEQGLGETDAAVAAAQRAVTLLPGNAQVQALFGTLESDLNNRAVALNAMRQAHKLSPDAPDIVQELGRQELNVFDIAGAERDLTPYVQTHPQDAETNYLMALIAAQKPPTPANLSTGLEYALRASRSLPSDLRVLGVLGQLYLRADQPAIALPIFLKGNHLLPTSEIMLHGLVNSYSRLGRAKEAEAMAGELTRINLRHEEISRLVFAAKKDPRDTVSGLRLALLQEMDGEFLPAQLEYDRLLRQSPQDARLRAALASFLRRRGRQDLARQIERLNFVP